MDLESPDRLKVTNLAFGDSYTAVLVSRLLGGRHREMSLTAKAYSTPGTHTDEAYTPGAYIGSTSRVYRVNTNRGSEEEIWAIDQLDSPKDAECPGR